LSIWAVRASTARTFCVGLVPLDSGSNPPSRDQISAAENALMTEASDLGQAGDTTVQSYVSDEAQALSSQLSGQPAIDVEADLDIAVTRRAAAATQANEPGCVVAAPAPRSAPTSTAATPGSSYRRPPCTSPGPSGAPETKPSCINQEGCRAVTVKSGSISCASALSIAEAAISSDQQTDNLNPTVKGFSCNVYPYEVDCASAGTSFSTNFGDTGQQSG
jgi:hypothetical protein